MFSYKAIHEKGKSGQNPCKSLYQHQLMWFAPTPSHVVVIRISFLKSVRSALRHWLLCSEGLAGTLAQGKCCRFGCFTICWWSCIELYDTSSYDQSCWVKALCLKNYLLTLRLPLSQGQRRLDLKWGRLVGHSAFLSPEAVRDLQQELPWKLNSSSSALLWTPCPATLAAAGKKIPEQKAHAKIS